MEPVPENCLDEVLDRARRGDARARDELFTRFYPRVKALVHAHLERELRGRCAWISALFSTTDIVQEVFSGVLRNLDGLRGARAETFVRYLVRAVHHRLIDAVRYHEAASRDARRTRHDAECTSAGAPAAEVRAAARETLRIYREALAACTVRERRLLELRLEEEVSFAEIARLLGAPSPDAARKAFGQARSRLVLRLRAAGLRL